MRKVLVFSILLVVGLAMSQAMPLLLPDVPDAVGLVLQFLTMTALAFIMIHVGYEFDLDKSNLRALGWDYVVAATAAAFPWIFCAVYFFYALNPPEAWGWELWKESSLASRFAAPTSAGVLFSMLAAAGLSATWVFRKARILAIFDDLDTILLMIPLKMMMVGLRWQLIGVVLIMIVQLWLAWRYLHTIRLPIRWPWVLGYSMLIAGTSEAVHFASTAFDHTVPIHIEVLLPAFVLGCVIARSGAHVHGVHGGSEEQDVLEQPQEKRVAVIVAGCFMLLVGMAMPPLFGDFGIHPSEESLLVADRIFDADDSRVDVPLSMSWTAIMVHVVIVTVIINLGKMFPAFCYRREAPWQHRLAVAVAMFPRGEVGAGVLVISLAYGIGGPMIAVAMLSLALNLVLTGVFIMIVKWLIIGGGQPMPRRPEFIETARSQQ